MAGENGLLGRKQRHNQTRELVHVSFVVETPSKPLACVSPMMAALCRLRNNTCDTASLLLFEETVWEGAPVLDLASGRDARYPSLPRKDAA